ncbi:MAG: IPT/TIG domain-containing protein [Deltaproteobacteria bacterium]|nr:IPT/TIG domain-containing protein [Deltaproteobacteria bacterium]
MRSTGARGAVSVVAGRTLRTLAVVAVALAAGCSDPEPVVYPDPTISGFSPTEGPTGTEVTITGTNFSTAGFNLVKFNGATATVSAATATELKVTVPDDATTGKVTVHNGSALATSSGVFTVTGSTVKPPDSPPIITNFSPMNGPVGTVVTITGSGFVATPTSNTVTIGGALATVTAASPTSLSATVPAGAVTGPISVSTLRGTFTTKANFTVAQAPEAPETPIAIAVNATQVNLSWGPVKEATGYNLYRSETPGVALTQANRITAAPVPSSPYADKGLTTGTAYYYVITAVNAHGESRASKEVSAVPTLPPPAPPAIASFSPTNGTVGTAVTITGSYFSPIATNNTVLFGGGVPAVVSTATATSLSVTVPAGATTGELTVTTASGTAKSASPFVVLLPPDPPTNVTSIAASATLVNINWTPVKGATGYHVYRTTTPGVATTTGNRITSAPVTVYPYADSGLTTGTAYYYVVTALNAYGESQPSKEVSAVPSTPPPSPPVIASFAPTNGTVGTAVTITGSYFSAIATNNTVLFGGGIPAVVNSAAPTTLTVTVPAGATTGAITVTTASGTATSASPFVVLLPPDPPGGVTAIAVNATQVNVSWSLVKDATGYNIYRTTTPGVALTAGNRITATPLAGPPHADTGLTTGTAYYYVVTAVSANGESRASTEVSAVPTTPPPSPPSIASFSPTNGTVGTVVTITGSYFSSIATNNTVFFGGNAPAVVSAATTSSLTVSVPVGATTGPITVTTASGTATSAASFVVLTAPAAPTGVTAVPASSTQVNLSWTPVTGATGYHVYRSTTAGVTVSVGNRITGTPVATPPYADAGLTAGTTYYYVVTALNANGESTGSTEVSATPPVALPAPGGVTAAAGVGQNTVSWNPVAGAASYNIYYATGATIPTTASTKIANAKSPYVHSNLTIGLRYTYVVTAVNAQGESVASMWVEATPVVPVVVARVVSGIPQTILQSNAEVSVKDSAGVAVPIATVTLNGTPLGYDSARAIYKGYVAVAAGGAVELSVSVNGAVFSLPTGITQFTTYPTITSPTNGTIWFSNDMTLLTKWNAGAPVTGTYNYGSIIFDTVSVNPYWANSLYWNNFISPSLANPGVGSLVPKGVVAVNKSVALFVYISKTETVTLGGAAGGTSVGSVDIIGASIPVTLTTSTP